MSIKHDINLALRILYMQENKENYTMTGLYNAMKNNGLGMRKQNFFALYKTLFPFENVSHFCKRISSFIKNSWKKSHTNYQVYLFLNVRVNVDYGSFSFFNDYSHSSVSDELYSFGMNNLYDFNRIQNTIDWDNVLEFCYVKNDGIITTKSKTEYFFMTGVWV